MTAIYGMLRELMKGSRETTELLKAHFEEMAALISFLGGSQHLGCLKPAAIKTSGQKLKLLPSLPHPSCSLEEEEEAAREVSTSATQQGKKSDYFVGMF